MIELLSKYLLIIFISMFKFVIGPVTAYAVGLRFMESVTLSALGMMITAFILAYAGKPMRNKISRTFFSRKKRKLFSRRNRRLVKIWRKYGMFGVAMLTPLLLTPPGGAMVAVSFGEKKSRIIFYMLISAITWSILINVGIFYLGHHLPESVQEYIHSER
ncbi:hypothetical protein [Algivirga pacifica]|uniref:Small multi-drug export protein n=1 Tax=Algivirga pacifica TaxID=1162670 RepID=A0ABP9D6Q7_9BACT